LTFGRDVVDRVGIMRAVRCAGSGGVEVMSIADVDAPQVGPGEVAIDVAASAVNRADILQRQGHYTPPPGASDILGLECSGVVAEVGEDVTDWPVGDRVCALLSGGGYADRVVVPAGQVLPVPEGVSLVDAGGLTEVACTVWSNVFMVAVLRPGELLLVHGGSSGIGTFAIQLAKAAGARVACTVGTREKAHCCTDLGADLAINYDDDDFVARIKDFTDGAGADVILDNMGAEYLQRNVETLAAEGRLVIIGMQGGNKGELDINTLLRKRGAVIATSLRGRDVAGKSAIVASVRETVWPLIEDGSIRTVIHKRIPLDDVRDAHALVESSTHIGKVLLTVNPDLDQTDNADPTFGGMNEH
jgi:putative PIG3 family NAD(P)H quinone oxidoreductase